MVVLISEEGVPKVPDPCGKEPELWEMLWKKGEGPQLTIPPSVQNKTRKGTAQSLPCTRSRTLWIRSPMRSVTFSPSTAVRTLSGPSKNSASAPGPTWQPVTGS